MSPDYDDDIHDPRVVFDGAGPEAWGWGTDSQGQPLAPEQFDTFEEDRGER